MSAKFTLERVSDPDIEPVMLAEAKRNLREFASATSRDDDILELIKGAREWVENYTGRALIDQTWRLTIDQGRLHRHLPIAGYPDRCGYYAGLFQWRHVGEIMLRKAPVLEITSFVSVDADGAETEIDADTYELREADSKWPRLVALSGATWQSASLMRITFRAGFADRLGSPQQDGSAVPVRFKQAMKLWVQAMYDTDKDMTPALLKAAEALIKSERSELSLA